MEIYDIVDKKCCVVNMSARNKEDFIKRLAQKAVKSDKLEGIDKETVFAKIMEREKQGTTGFGNGIAIPHARIPGMKDFIVFVISSRHGIDYQALDKKKVHLIFVILGPEEKAKEHLQLLASISRVLSITSAKKELKSALTATALYESFIRNTKVAITPKKKIQKMKLMYIVLYFDEYLYDILELFIQEGIEGATIVDSYGMGEYISNIPLFATFIGFMNENKNHSKLIMALIAEDDIPKIIQEIEEITGDLDKKDGAMILTLDVSFYKGSMKMM